MADKEARRERIRRLNAEIAERRNAVTFEEVDQIVNQIKLLGELLVVKQPTTHGYQYTIGAKIIRVKKNPRGPMLRCYVVDAMVDLGLYKE